MILRLSSMRPRMARLASLPCLLRLAVDTCPFSGTTVMVLRDRPLWACVAGRSD